MPAAILQPKILTKKASVVHIKTRGRIICFCARACQINQHNILQSLILCFVIIGIELIYQYNKICWHGVCFNAK